MSLNRVVIMGRLGRDIKLEHTNSGVAVCNFSLAVDRDFKDKNTGERGTDWIDVIAWRSTAEFISRYFGKGSMMVVDGRLEVQEWNDKEGNKRRSVKVSADNVYFGDSKRSNGDNNQKQAPPYTPPTDTSDSFSELEDDTGDLPF